MEYKTVEGDEIKKGQSYELRSGKQAFIVQLYSKKERHSPILFAINGYDTLWKCRSDGAYDADLASEYDIMRPWKEKEKDMSKIEVTDESSP